MIYFSDFDSGGGGPPAGGDLRTVVGNGNWTAQSSTTTSFAQLIKITAPSGANSALSSVFASFSGFTAGVGLKALLVADSGGSPANGAPIAVGTATVPGSSVDPNLVVEMPFASAQTLTAGADYWIGFAPSASVPPVLADANFSNVTSMQVGVTYASPSWDAATDATGPRIAMWAPLSQAGAATGLHQQGSTTIFAGAGTMRIMLPPHAIGDKIVLHSSQNFGTVPTISGYSSFASNAYAGGTHILLDRTIDGTEDGTVFVPAPSGNNRTFVATVFRGGGAREGTATSASSGTSPVSPAVTVTNAPARVFNFLLSGEGGVGASNTGSADSWTDVYALGTLTGNDFTMSLSYQDRASSGSAGTETRTISNGFYQWTCFAVPDA